MARGGNIGSGRESMPAPIYGRDIISPAGVRRLGAVLSVSPEPAAIMPSSAA